MDCPATGEFCPALTDTESKKDIARDSLGATGMLAAARRSNRPYEQISVRRRLALKFPDGCNSRSETDDCGLEENFFNTSNQ